MADDPNPELRAELVASLAVINPQIRGLHDLLATSISEELRAVIRNEIGVRERRRDLTNTVLADLDLTHQARNALEADGYPALSSVVIDQTLFTELQGEETDLDAAVALFTGATATTLTLKMGEPTPKT